MFNKILIANRGEIAVRIIRACKEMGIASVAVYSEADREAMHTRLADQAVCIGPAPSNLSYLNIPAIMAAAEITDAEAIHPGYGFLAENAEFADIVQTSGYTWIGPSPESMRIMGDKVSAKNKMREAGVPLVPGSDGAVTDLEDAKRIAHKAGYPVIIKASAGGGGRGMKVVHSDPALASAISMCQSEAAAAFGNDMVFIEKFLEEPRHIEVQVLGDTHGNIVHLFERECSMQRKNQKVLEEAPSPFVDEKTRKAICDAGVAAAAAVNYVGAGTIEFLMNPDKSFYFIEMNTRIQVEHPVTEWISGVDLIEWQIRVANGEKLAFKQSDIKMKGHAIECRINAEHPFKFTPSPGTISLYHAPGGRSVRMDSAIYSGYSIPPFYDSMIGKVITHARDRQKCIRRMQRAIDELAIIGITTNQELHRRLLANAAFQSGDFNIHFLERWLKEMNA
ncbi:MAG: acetyl-CoA carboxylase biotin carboxylase subunit [Zetaproteobacteria bacterium CG12_big_fil_rev_8_21_14_0_65_55_1124]|nr:MAG: acetyl-CoA carboxylase biotin carboxylase subunit [Zetaproteobacteria bacterium CG1_02_55_237]PIS19535.1 MAG: acetyl-CoA carboxylase biotin carboxylase subunit [Zetaproteobacteria bacterium CG08_land_8_20_14_0_20_55_17]PIW42364.1 MAG: acetyl-CoA carboxylase biotin carboxylase subunit [Zetaproteobacteria bacterium CG12_big_fil_rev_8_21_14_0_65_55_1124]PIY52835.1 MAG: acetyl-CoA carboxylase biotin carboxylase subunit [Zetaproteobacteria bacterium CG_4_10_14_0_8_um_filter_55_43]PIZ38041.1 